MRTITQGFKYIQYKNEKNARKLISKISLFKLEIETLGPTSLVFICNGEFNHILKKLAG